MSDNTLKTDVTIVGAGLVGLSAAVAMRKAGYDVVLVDNQIHPQISAKFHEDAADWDQRIYAISPKNAQWLASLGAWQLLDVSRIGEMQAMEIWGDATDAPLYLSAEDVNADDLGFIVEERALKKALMQQVRADGVHTLFGNKCIELTTDPNQATLYLDNRQVIESKLLIAADGVNSWVRRQLSIGVQDKPYFQTAIVANFVTEKPHGNIARQWFRQEQYTQEAAGHCGILAWLPLPGNKISIVWSVPAEYAANLMQLDNEEFTNEVTRAGSSVLGKMTMITKPVAFPLVLKKAGVFAKDSVVLVGDAVHRIHPMAGQGVNLGFRDVIDLKEIIINKHQYQPINDASLLKHYTRARKADLLNMLMLTNGLYHLFESQNVIVQKVRNLGLIAANQQHIKKMLVKNAITL